MESIEFIYFRLVKWMEKINSVPTESAAMLMALLNILNGGFIIGTLKYQFAMNINFESKTIPMLISGIIILFNYFFLENRSRYILNKYSSKSEKSQRQANTFLIIYVLFTILSIIVLIFYIQ